MTLAFRLAPLLLLIGLSACGASHREAEPAHFPAEPPPRPAPAIEEVGDAAVDAPAALPPEATPATPATPPAEGEVTDEPDAAPTGPAAPAPSEPTAEAAPAAPALTRKRSGSERPAQPPHRELRDVEARVSVEVPRVDKAVTALRAVASAEEGTIVSESFEDDEHHAHATITLRVPARRVERTLTRVEALGRVQLRHVQIRELGKEYFDAELRLRMLRAAVQRYEEILERAATVEAVLAVEKELERTRTEIERIQGQLRWLRDRAARATVTVSLHSRRAGDDLVHPEPRLFPGVRAGYLAVLRGAAGNRGYGGAGLSVRFSRHGGFDLEGFRGALASPGLDGFLATAGGEIYSELLGDGLRRWLNPYVGMRIGYARIEGSDEAVGAITTGVEIYKSELAVLELDLRGLAFFLGEESPHLGAQAALGAFVAF